MWKIGYYKNEEDWESPNQLLIPIKAHQVREPSPHATAPTAPLIESLGKTLQMKANETYMVDSRLAKQLLKVLATMPGIQPHLRKRQIQVYDSEGFFMSPDKDIEEQDLTDLQPMYRSFPGSEEKEPEPQKLMPLQGKTKTKQKSPS